MAILESMMKDVQCDIQEIRDSIRTVFRAADKVSEDAQKTGLRVDDLESEWRQWDDGWHNEATPPEPLYVEGNRNMVLLTPAGNTHSSGNVHADLLGLGSDSLHKWWDATTPQRAEFEMPDPTPTGPPTTWAHGGDNERFIAERMALRSAPPGIELTTASAVGNIEGERPEGLIQARQRSTVRDGPRGDVYFFPYSNLEAMQPGVMTTSLMNGRQSLVTLHTEF